MDRPNRITPLEVELVSESGETGEDGLSLEELSRSYLNAMGASASHQPIDASESELDFELAALDAGGNAGEESDGRENTDDGPLNPQSIVEAILFVGRPDGQPVSAVEIASLMRGVGESEVVELIGELNRIYEDTGRATRIEKFGAGFQLGVANDLGAIKDRFYGRVREVRLNQTAIDCMALVAYQPGISREKIEDQRGQASGPILNQLVRRQLLEMRHESVDKKRTQCYYPTDRMLELAGLNSLEDLPQAEDFE